MRRTSGGFTLIEVLVVVMIVAMIAAAVTLSLPTDRSESSVRTETRRLSTLLRLASEEAVIQGLDLGLLISQDEYSFYLFDYRQQRWIDVEDHRLLKAHALPEHVGIDLELDGTEIVLGAGLGGEFDADDFAADDDDLAGPQPQIFILSSGELTPFTLTIYSTSDGDVVEREIVGHPNGRIEVTGERTATTG